MTDMSPEAKQLLERARADFGPSEAQLISLNAAVASRIAGGNGSAPNGQGGGPAAAGGPVGWSGAAVLGKAIGAILLVGLVGAGFAYRSRSVPSTRAPQVIAVALSPVAASARPSTEAEGAGAPEVPSVPWTDLPRAPLGPRALTTRAAAPPSRAAVDVGSNNASPVRADPEPSILETAPETTARVSLTDEIRIVRSAHAALDRGDTTAALALTEEHRSRYPHGTLREENLALRVRALCAVGRPDAARSAALALLRTAPDSPYRAGLRASCVGPHFDE